MNEWLLLAAGLVLTLGTGLFVASEFALVNLDRALEAPGIRSRLILQVHDEVILEVPPEEKDDMAVLVRTVMAEAADLSVPLEVNLSFGDSWATAK